MGITGELVRSVFSRSRSVGTQESSARSHVVEKRKWSSVRSYLCGDEFNSVLAEEDSASGKSSEATVTQPMLEESTEKGDIQSEETKEKHNSMPKLFHEEDAAIIIQSALRRFLARSRNEEEKLKDSKQENVSLKQSPSRESVGTSIEVQTGNSVEGLSLQEEILAIPLRIQPKVRTHIFKIKEDWDDSTVSSNVSKMRIQNKLEATTRRERALAYAFSQQMRICSKKQTKSDGADLNTGWSWLERWMATRPPKSSSAENRRSQQLELFNNSEKIMMGKAILDVSWEEKESCGSNEVSVQLDRFSAKDTDGFKPTKNRLTTTRTVSRQKTVLATSVQKRMARFARDTAQRR